MSKDPRAGWKRWWRAPWARALAELKAEIDAERVSRACHDEAASKRLVALEASMADTQDAVAALNKLTSADPHERSRGSFHRLRREIAAISR